MVAVMKFKRPTRINALDHGAKKIPKANLVNREKDKKISLDKNNNKP
jgi:hypothetical protein